MTKFKARVIVTLKSGVLDPQGNAVAAALGSMGFEGAAGVRVGKVFDVEVSVPDAAAARALVEGMCERLLANTVIEDWEIEIAGENERRERI